jgi:hypothetical protein
MAAPFDAKKAIDELLQSLDNRVCAKVFAELHEKVMENKKRDDDFLRRQKNRYMKFLEDQRNSCEDDASGIHSLLSIYHLLMTLSMGRYSYPGSTNTRQTAFAEPYSIEQFNAPGPDGCFSNPCSIRHLSAYWPSNFSA